jgi:hypothetical protein
VYLILRKRYKPAKKLKNSTRFRGLSGSVHAPSASSATDLRYPNTQANAWTPSSKPSTEVSTMREA